MNTLKNHTIVYDDECPACARYTAAFVSTNMLDRDGRQPFAKMKDQYNGDLDWQRAGDEIAMIDHETGVVTYGINSLFKIIENAFPVFKPLFAIKWFQFLMTKLYFFISYNRKAIVPGKVFEGYNTCSPKLNLTYRWVYIIFTWLVTSLVLTFYSKLLLPVVPETNFWREFAICGGQVLFQGLVVGAVFKERLIYYLGNLMTVSFAGALMLLPMLLLSNLVNSNLIYFGYFGLVVMAMFYEHIRRVGILELPWFLSGTWVVYRLIILHIIL